MTWFSATIVFLISWWLVFLATLSVGVRSQVEEGEQAEGTEGGAPVHHMLPKKAVWATIGAALVTLIAFVVLSSGIIPAPDVPWNES